MKKVLKTVLDVLIVALFLAAVVVLVSSLTQQKSGVPGAFGYTIASVQTNSMAGVIDPGDMVIGRINDGSTDYEVGDIVTFSSSVDGHRITITHRITDVQIIDGIRFYETWGDNRELDYEGEKDVCYTADEGLRAPGDIVSKHVLTLRGAGRVIDFLKTPVGFIICVALPLLVYIIYEIYVLINAIVAYKKKQILQEVSENTNDEVREAIIREYLAQQNAEEIPEKGA